MTNEERAKELLSSIRFVRSEPAIDIIFAYADEIRRECAQRACAYQYPDKPTLTGPSGLYAAIMGREPAWEDSCQSCKHNGNQGVYPSGCTGCGADGEYLNYEPARGAAIMGKE